MFFTDDGDGDVDDETDNDDVEFTCACEPSIARLKYIASVCCIAVMTHGWTTTATWQSLSYRGSPLEILQVN